jgi:Spy/CpxP family protein refolding chaperone
MDFLSGLLVYGPLGIWAAAATLALVAKDRELGRLRDAHAETITKLTEGHAEKLEALGKENAVAITAATQTFAQQVSALGTAQAQALREQADRADRQVSELQQRTFTIVTTLSDKMTALADALTRRGR